MYRMMDRGFLFHMFHDIDFSAIRPSVIDIFLRHHPDSGECAIGVTGDFGFYFHPSEGEVKLTLRFDTAGFVFITYFFGFQYKSAVFYVSLVITFGHFVVPVGACFLAEYPFGRVRIAVYIELVHEENVLHGVVKLGQYDSIGRCLIVFGGDGHCLLFFPVVYKCCRVR